jgi:hypothetical protein
MNQTNQSAPGESTPDMRCPRRHHLYLWVWEEPAIHVAAELKISGNALRKRCLKFNIPLPGRGYWAQMRVGLHLPVTPLPEPDDDPELPYAVSVQRFESLNALPWPSLGRPLMLGENSQIGSDESATLAPGKPMQDNQSEVHVAAHRRPVSAPERTEPSLVAPGGQESNPFGDEQRIGEPDADALSEGMHPAERQMRPGLAQPYQLPSRMTSRLQEQARKLRDIEQALQELAVETAAIISMR